MCDELRDWLLRVSDPNQIPWENGGAGTGNEDSLCRMPRLEEEAEQADPMADLEER